MRLYIYIVCDVVFVFVSLHVCGCIRRSLMCGPKKGRLFLSGLEALSMKDLVAVIFLGPQRRSAGGVPGAV